MASKPAISSAVTPAQYPKDRAVHSRTRRAEDGFAILLQTFQRAVNHAAYRARHAEENMQQLQVRIREIAIKAIPKLRSPDINNDTSLFDCWIDSLDHAKLLIVIEDELGIEIGDEEIPTPIA